MARFEGEGTACPAEGALPDGAEDSPTSRLELVFGRGGVERLAASTVLVFGVGGVGSNCVEALARGGVGGFVLVDGDAVQASNINRQAIAFRSTVGRCKVEVMREMIAAINPEARVVAIDRFVLPEDVESIMDEWAPRVDYVVDAIDTVASKLAIAVYADRAGVPLVSSMGAANKLRPDCFEFADIYRTANDPLCRVVRKEARKRGIRALTVLYSREEPARLPLECGQGDESAQAAAPDDRTERQGGHRAARPTLGTASYVPPIMGQMTAGYVIRRLVGLEG